MTKFQCLLAGLKELERYGQFVVNVSVYDEWIIVDLSDVTSDKLVSMSNYSFQLLQSHGWEYILYDHPSKMCGWQIYI